MSGIYPNKFQEQRYKLVKELIKKGINDRSVLDAVNTVPREIFMAAGRQNDAYVDKAFPIDEGQTISQPFTVAYQTQLLSVEPGDKILEIGTGSAYQASILAVMGATVFTIERQRKLYEKNLNFGYLHRFNNLHLFYGDGFAGLPDYAPFNKILITAAAPEIPNELVAQLSMPGILVAPVGPAPSQQMIKLTKHDNGDISEEDFGNFSFVPMLKGRQD